MKLIEEIILDNGLNLQIFDLTRVIAADTVKVEIFFQTKVSLKESYFISTEDYLQVKNVMGEELVYEHRLERSFVSKDNENEIRDSLIDTFKNNSLDYLAALDFAKKLALSKLKEIRKNPYKYQSRKQSDPDR